MNKVLINGVITKAPELQNTSNGNEVVRFGLTTSWKERENDFVPCTVTSELSSYVLKNITEDMDVEVVGHLHSEFFKNTGTLEVVVEDISFLNDGSRDIFSDEIEIPTRVKPKKIEPKEVVTEEYTSESNNDYLDTNEIVEDYYNQEVLDSMNFDEDFDVLETLNEEEAEPEVPTNEFPWL